MFPFALLAIYILSNVVGGHAPSTRSQLTNGRCGILESNDEQFKTWVEDNRTLQLFYRGESIPITLENSDRVSQRLVNNIVIIILKEVMRYSAVEEVGTVSKISARDVANTSSALSRIAYCDKSTNCDRDHLANSNTESVLVNDAVAAHLSSILNPPLDAMINMEVAVASGFQFDHWKKNVTEMGPLSDVEGRYGWYVPAYLDQEFSLLHSSKILFNRTFQNRFNSRKWFCSEEMDCNIVPGYGCDTKRDGSNCSYLLAPFVDIAAQSESGGGNQSQNDLLNCQLEIWRVPINVVYVTRSRYLSTLSELLKTNSPVLFLAWDLDVVNFQYKLARIDTSSLLHSRIDADNSHHHRCHRLLHEINAESFHPKRHQLNKYAWPLLRVRALPAFNLVRNVQLSTSEYKGLLINATRVAKSRDIDLLKRAEKSSAVDDVIFDVACEWLKSNQNSWKRWFNGVTKKDKIFLVGMFAQYRDREYGRVPLQLGVEAAARMGVEEVNRNTRVLPNADLELLVIDTKCLTDTAVKEFISIYVDESRRKKIAGIVGPGCSETAEGIKDVTKQLDWIIISYASEGGTLTQKDKLDKKVTNFYRLVPSAQSLPHAYIEIFRKWSWNQAAVITMQDKEHKSFQDRFISQLKEKRGDIYHFPLTEASDVHILEIFGNRTKESVNAFGGGAESDEKKKNSIRGKYLRIIVGINFFDYVARRLLCLAYREKMTMEHGYQWFLPGWYPIDWWNTTKYKDDFTHGPSRNRNRKGEETCTEEEMLKAINGYMFLDYNTTQTSRSDDDTVTVDGNPRSLWWRRYNATEHATIYGQYAYDAVWMYAQALDKMNASSINELHTLRVYQEFQGLLNFTNFTGVSGEINWFNRTRDRDDVSIDVYQFLVDRPKGLSKLQRKRMQHLSFSIDHSRFGNDSTVRVPLTSHRSKRGDLSVGEQGVQNIRRLPSRTQVRRIMNVFPETRPITFKEKNEADPQNEDPTAYNVNNIQSGTASITSLPDGHAFWVSIDATSNASQFAVVEWMTPDGNVPSDGSDHLDSHDCRSLAPLMNLFKLTECSTAVLVANILGFGALLIVLAFGYVIYRQKAMVYWQREAKLRALLEQGNDEWEVPRDKVVVNRRIGEGAFGVVCGGDAQLEEGGPWISVAVKTLKPHAEDLEKISFLSEADMMKTFDHANVIKLLGVVTRGEPLMNIMEFMLYGDLKNYLLSRRSLVDKFIGRSGEGGEGGCGSEEVNAARLTQMSLDVAKGLEYLNKVGFVHRDISGRNCLVGRDMTIKIGDFGMARRLYDHDYYRFTNQCKLPVRWMSPESLSDGLFTFASDVWSYGVLVYEIVTFGSFPYQGLTNSQVIECVKAGRTLPVPDKLLPKARNLLQNCWQKDPSLRPLVGEIAQLLEDNSCMITPSLDPPAASVAMEGSLEPVVPQKLKTHREKVQQAKVEDKSICTVRPEETVPHQAAALFGMGLVSRNQDQILPMGAASSCDWKDWSLNDDLNAESERMPLTGSTTLLRVSGGAVCAGESSSSGSRDHCNNARGNRGSTSSRFNPI